MYLEPFLVLRTRMNEYVHWVVLYARVVCGQFCRCVDERSECLLVVGTLMMRRIVDGVGMPQGASDRDVNGSG